MLETVGVRIFDEEVYRALLRRPSSSTAELADAVREAPARTRGSLARLERLGLVRRLDSRRFVPIAPKTALAALLHRRQAQVQAEFDAVRAAIDELTQDYRSGEMQTHPAGLIEVITGAEAIYQRALELWRTATAEILIFEKPPYAARQAGARYDEVETERPLLERGVRLRGVYTQEVLEIPGHMAAVAKLAELGEEARVLPELPIKLHIYDRRIAMVPLTTDVHAGQSRAIVHESGLLDALIALFESYWQRAHPITSLAVPDGGLDDEEAAVLRMLAAGMKDHAIARQLGISRRTATRRVEHVLDRLDAASRFQAGAQAARRGWI